MLGDPLSKPAFYSCYFVRNLGMHLLLSERMMAGWTLSHIQTFLPYFCSGKENEHHREKLMDPHLVFLPFS